MFFSVYILYRFKVSTQVIRVLTGEIKEGGRQMKDELDERKKRVLQAIVDDYIESAEPVGSRTLAQV